MDLIFHQSLMWSRSIWIVLLLSISALPPGLSRQCGFPGRPKNGTSFTAALISRPGDTVHYTCRPGYTLFGEAERVCLDSGIWAGRQPLCEFNLALERSSLVSATLWNYRASLAVDGNPDTCCFTPRTSEQRWWQVDLGADNHVGSVALIINKDSYQEFTIFVIQLLSKSEALYKPCAMFKGRFQNPRILFSCNDGHGHQGRFVYIRDDRRDQDYFGLCEVEVFAYRDDSACGEPEEPFAGHVLISSEGIAIYSCDSGYRLLAESNRTCERDAHWTGHAPQCEAINCGQPQQISNADVKLLNHSTLWNSVATYTCRTGYAFLSGIVATSISCLSSGAWENVNITCIPDDDRNLPVKLTGKEWGQEVEKPGRISDVFPFGISGIISIAVGILLIISLSMLAIIVVRRLQSKKKTRETPQSSTNDLIISNAKDVTFDNLGVPGFQRVVVTQPQYSTPKVPTTCDTQGNKMLSYFSQAQESSCYDALQSFQNIRRYSSILVTDTEQNPNYSRIKIGDSDGGDCVQEKPKVQTTLENENLNVEKNTDRLIAISEYGSVRNLQNTSEESSNETVQTSRPLRTKNKSKSKICRSIPTALKLLLHPSSKTTDSELGNEVVPAEIMALYAQVDKTKKRKYRDGASKIMDPNNVTGNHASSQTEEECECTQHPISDIVRFSTDSCSPAMWNGNAKDCASKTLRNCRTSSNSQQLISVPNIRYIHSGQGSEPHIQILECNQL